MKFLVIILMILSSATSFAGSCKEQNDQSTELNQAIRKLVEQKDSTLAFNLLSHGMPANAANACGATLLHMAAIMNNYKLAQALISGGANPNAKNHLGQTPVFLAANWSSNEILSLLLNNGGDPNVNVDEGSKYNTALMIAVVNKNIEGVKLLIKAGADPEYKNSKGISAKSIAAESSMEVLRYAVRQVQP